jgi:type II secretory pathway pseudopilin PulG
VVAIIAILAAIALPNFLEAQTRAKVSRMRADIRSTQTALEIYAVDWNSYPPHLDNPRELEPLTTPLAYFTSVPRDVFANSRSNNFHIHGDRVIYEDLVDVQRINPVWGGGGGSWLRGQLNAGHRWLLSSVGPDGDETAWDEAVQYDPTNGVLSRGDVYITGP